MKKLSLNRETLVTLNPSDLSEALGADVIIRIRQTLVCPSVLIRCIPPTLIERQCIPVPVTKTFTSGPGPL